MKLRDLLLGTELVQPIGNADLEITSVAYDSRKVVPGAIFFAIHGEKTDGNRFIPDALERGARVVASELPRPEKSNGVPSAGAGAHQAEAPRWLPRGVKWAQVASARKALATAAANFYGRPAEGLKLAGVTGTNGKTTTTYLIDSILRAAGQSTGLFGTIAYRTPRGTRLATNTTPESLEL
ncbi:MAG TPA: Mur ligase domain-containing protein, partial [Candidatus Acidoferrales bacterium]|nr:Mur ligase domain-containing protein [Candidatus Acidoferrales bacterium]